MSSIGTYRLACLLANTNTGTFFNSSSLSMVKSSDLDVGSLATSDESMT